MNHARPVQVLGQDREGLDAVSALTVFLFCLFVIPSRLIFSPLGAFGTPAQILGLCAIIAWFARSLAQPNSVRGVNQPVRVAMLLYLVAVLLSCIAALRRPIEPVEARASLLATLSVLAYLGILSTATDGIGSMQRLDDLLRRTAAFAGALATLGVAQFMTGLQFTNYIQIPGLRSNSDLASVIARNGFARPAGTATHPIEFCVVLTMVLPIALHYAMTDTHRSRIRRWYPVAAIATAVPISLSRTAVVCAAAVLLLLLPTWTKYQRRAGYAAMVVLLGMLYVLIPGILGTIGHLFTGISDDGSALSRTDSYSLAGQYISRAPIFGRGIGTFLPSYRILDNQYLGALIEVGLVGTIALLGLFVTGVGTAWRIRASSADPRMRSLAQGLAAAVVAAACSCATFDALGFPMVPGVMFLLLGCIGALKRVLTEQT